MSATTDFPDATPGTRLSRAQQPLMWAAFKLIVAVPVYSALIYALSFWALYLAEVIFTSDRWNYARFHFHGVRDHINASEPFWQIIAPAIGQVFQDRASRLSLVPHPDRRAPE